MSKKSLIMVLSLVLALSVGLGGTLAYLTDRDAEANIFTVGDVDIELEEDFEQGAALIPGVKIEKIPTIVNEGNNDAWVWMTWSIPSGLDRLIQGTEQGSNENPVHWNPTGATADGYVNDTYVQNAIADGLLPEGITAQEIIDNKMTWNVFNSLGEGLNCYAEVINGEEYNTYVLLYNKALTPGEETLPSVYQLYLDQRVDVDPEGNMYFVKNGEVTALEWNINEDGAPIIYVAAYAIQKEGFATVEEAYEAYGDQWGNNGKAKYGTVTIAAPEDGAVRPAGYAPAIEGEVIDNLIIQDNSTAGTNLRALYQNGITGDLTVENSYLDGTYAMNVTADEAANAVLTVEGTTLAGWTSYSGWKSASFTDCTFKANSNPEIYNNIRPYDDTAFVNCEFKDTTFWMDNFDGTEVTFEGCTVNGEPLTAELLTAMVVEGDTTKMIIK